MDETFSSVLKRQILPPFVYHQLKCLHLSHATMQACHVVRSQRLLSRSRCLSNYIECIELWAQISNYDILSTQQNPSLYIVSQNRKCG